jgi:hypothetical protein
LANVYAITNGNWSAGATWNTGVVPTSADDVFTNNFTVNMDVNATVISLNNTFSLGAVATPIMTSNTTPSPYSVSASNELNGAAWLAFDRNTATAWSTTSGAGGVANIIFDFSAGDTRVLKAYSIYTPSTNPGNNPRTWTFDGSNNGSTWITLDTVSLGSSIGASSVYNSSILANTTAYRYYRLNVTTTTNVGGVQVGELALWEANRAAIASGGSFNFNTAGVTVSATSVGQAVSNIFTITNTTGTVTLSVASNINAVSSQTTMTYSGAGNFTFTCPNIVVAISSGTAQVIVKSGSGLLTYNGNPICLPVVLASGAINYCINSTNGDVIVNGNPAGSPTNNGNGTVSAIRQTSGNLTINGNIVPDGTISLNVARTAVNFSGTTLTLNGNTQDGSGFAIVSSGTVNINGTLRGGNSVYANANITINMNGDVYAGLSPAINCSAFTASIVNLTGNMYNTLGRMAIWCPNVFISNTATTMWRMDTGGGNYKFLYSADSTPNLPPQTDVRFGTTFGPALSLTGTMVTVSAANTRKDVPTDNTVGTGELTSADIISGINASSDSLAVRLKNTLTDTTAGNIISQYNNS